ncbi:MAG: hypothetical protein JZD41_09055 [Thermoproteus sp.]|nr:hypothetical protein [Thermoproteus sp.]
MNKLEAPATDRPLIVYDMTLAEKNGKLVEVDAKGAEWRFMELWMKYRGNRVMYKF